MMYFTEKFEKAKIEYVFSSTGKDRKLFPFTGNLIYTREGYIENDRLLNKINNFFVFLYYLKQKL